MEIDPLERKNIPETKRWVVKIGSAMLTGNGQGLDREAFAELTGIFPELASDPPSYGPASRPSLRPFETALVAPEGRRGRQKGLSVRHE